MGASSMGAAGFRAAALALACGACTSIAVDQRTFEGTRWQVAAINGHPTPRGGRFSFSFGAKTFRARMGCNEASGEYRITADRLVPLMTRTTEMACEADPPGPIPLMTYERWGFAVLRQPMQMRLAGQRVAFSNSAGSIELERAP